MDKPGALADWQEHTCAAPPIQEQGQNFAVTFACSRSLPNVCSVYVDTLTSFFIAVTHRLLPTIRAGGCGDGDCVASSPKEARRISSTIRDDDDDSRGVSILNRNLYIRHTMTVRCLQCLQDAHSKSTSMMKDRMQGLASSLGLPPGM